MSKKIIAKYYLPIITIFFVALIVITYPLIWVLRFRGRRKTLNNSKPLNVLYVIATLELGGAESQLVRLLKGLDRKQINPLLCCTVGGGPLEKEVKEEGIQIFILKKKNKFNFTVVFDLIKMIKENQIDVIHSYLFTSNFWARLAGILAGTKVIIASERSAYKKPNLIIYDRVLSYFTDSIICNSEAVKDFQIKSEKISPKKLDVVYNGINVSDFDQKLKVSKEKAIEYRRELGISNEDFVIGNICRITPEKDLELWLETAAIIVNSKKNTKFLLVGGANPNIGEEVPYQAKILKMMEDLGLKKNVILTGYSHDVTKQFAIMDLFFLSSKIEGFPGVLVEAMTASLPTVSTSAGGAGELISSNKFGVIIKNGKANDFAEVILNLMNDENKRGQMAKAGRKRIEDEFSVQTLVEKTVAVYKKFLK